MTKTNAMRILDKAKIAYTAMEYVPDENLNGNHIAELINLPPEMVFKTIAVKGDKTGINIFCIPVNCEIDLKKAASVSGNKKVEMIAVKDLLGSVGYIRGACSPIGMKKKFPAFIDEKAKELEFITVSGGMKGCQLKINPLVLAEFITAEFKNITI